MSGWGEAGSFILFLFPLPTGLAMLDLVGFSLFWLMSYVLRCPVIWSTSFGYKPAYVIFVVYSLDSAYGTDLDIRAVSLL